MGNTGVGRRRLTDSPAANAGVAINRQFMTPLGHRSAGFNSVVLLFT